MYTDVPEDAYFFSYANNTLLYYEILICHTLQHSPTSLSLATDSASSSSPSASGSTASPLAADSTQSRLQETKAAKRQTELLPDIVINKPPTLYKTQTPSISSSDALLHPSMQIKANILRARGRSLAVKAVSAGQLAMASSGVYSVNFDEALEAMRLTALDMSSKYKETSLSVSLLLSLYSNVSHLY